MIMMKNWEFKDLGDLLPLLSQKFAANEIYNPEIKDFP